MVNIRSEAVNETGNAKLPKLFFREGYRESWRRAMTASQLTTEKICASAFRFFSSTKL
jgi:hypothetical protein